MYKGDWWTRCKVGEVDKVTMYRLISESLRGTCTDAEALQLADDFEAGLGVTEEMKELLRELHEAGLKLGVLSNYDEGLEERLTMFGVSKYFRVIGNSWRLKAAKPDPVAYERVLELIQSRPAESFFIDDKQANVVAAQRVGMRASVFESVAQLRRVLIEHGVRIAPPSQ